MPVTHEVAGSSPVVPANVFNNLRTWQHPFNPVCDAFCAISTPRKRVQRLPLGVHPDVGVMLQHPLGEVPFLRLGGGFQGRVYKHLGTGCTTLLHIDLNGNAQPVWHQPQPSQTWGIASPDGRRLAMPGVSADANVWMIDNL